MGKMVSGYLHPFYAESLAEFGVPRDLSQSGGRVLVRRIPGVEDLDAIGSYPIFSCQDWGKMNADLEDVGNELVSLALVADPFGNYDSASLKRSFNVVIPFKDHFVLDLRRQIDNIICRHHSRHARKALQALEVERCPEPRQFLDEWTCLYSNLIRRRNIRGISAFSRSSFARQMEVPGLVMFRAVHKEKTIGITLWFIQGNVSFYHLGASSDVGYKLRATFALLLVAIRYFTEQGLRWIDLGAGAGISNGGADGLSRFKEGWASETRTAYFCGRIFNKKRYSEITIAKGSSTTDYFPAYRQGEFK